jgi:hypothetical protein
MAQWLRKQWNWSRPVIVEPKPYTDPRTLSQNALFHVWCQEMAEQFAERGKMQITMEQMKELMKYKFLGTEDVVINKTVIPGQLRHTSGLDKGEMTQLLDQIHDWALDHGVMLTNPADSEYMRLREAQTA